ncbi:MAG: hypothetical protein ACRESX_07840, partial [Gammaproteobacteria bacterium]
MKRFFLALPLLAGALLLISQTRAVLADTPDNPPSATTAIPSTSVSAPAAASTAPAASASAAGSPATTNAGEPVQL